MSRPELLGDPVEPRVARRALSPGTLFVAYSVGDRSAVVFAVSAQGPVRSFSVALSSAELERSVRSLRAALTRPDSAPSEARGAGRALYSRLFPPLLDRQVKQARRLVISPDGPLWDVPFAALGIDRPIAYTPSLTAFAQVRKRPRPRPRGHPVALIVGDPSAGGAQADAKEERALMMAEGRPPAPLPAARDEAVRIARLYGATPLIGNRATEEAVRKRLPGADVVHFATHGFSNPGVAFSSGVLLAVSEGNVSPQSAQRTQRDREREKEGSPPTTLPLTTPPLTTHYSPLTDDDGALQAWELLDPKLRLNADLVVLSASDSARGQVIAGEGVVGLTRAFQVAGARSVLAAQWKVADRSTATLMVAFHQGLRKGLPKDAALHRAMALVRKDPKTAHPFYWAPFVLVGDPDN